MSTQTLQFLETWNILDRYLSWISLQYKYKVRGEAIKNPGEGIVKIAEEEKAEMIVLGTRGLGKVASFFAVIIIMTFEFFMKRNFRQKATTK